MAYSNKIKQRNYQRKWIKERREKWFKNKKCAHCGSISNLEIHHRNSKTKVSHKIFGWNKIKQKKELKKCIVLCRKCHKIETENKLEGQYKYSSKLINDVRQLLDLGVSHRKISTITGISKTHVGAIHRGERRKNDPVV